MSDNSFDSEALNSDSIEDEKETKNQSYKEENKKENKKENEEPKIKNQKLINSISNVLISILEENKKLKNYKEIVKKQSKMTFSANSIPNISINEYLTRIQIYSGIEKSTLILSLIQIDHICKRSEVTLTYYNIHRLLFGAILISIKFNEDSYYDNKYYSEIAGVKLKELKMIEYNFLEMNNFNVFINHKEYEQYRQYLEEFNNIPDDEK